MIRRVKSFLSRLYLKFSLIEKYPSWLISHNNSQDRTLFNLNKMQQGDDRIFFHFNQCLLQFVCVKMIKTLLIRLGLQRRWLQLFVQNCLGGGLWCWKILFADPVINTGWQEKIVSLKLMFRFAWDQFSLETKSTIGVEFATRSLEIGKNLQINRVFQQS